MTEDQIARLICCGAGGCREPTRCRMAETQRVKPTLAARDIVRAMARTYTGGPIEPIPTWDFEIARNKGD